MDDRPDNNMDGVELAEAADILGSTTEALRKRIQRGTLQGYKVDGKWYVILPNQDKHQDNIRTSQEDLNFKLDNQEDSDRTSPDDSQDVIQAYTNLVGSLKEEISFLREELASRTEENRRKDHLLASRDQTISSLIQRIPELPEVSQTLQEQESIKRDVLDVVQKEIAATQQHMEERESELDRRLQERDRKLMETLRALQEQKPKKRWWQR